MSAKESSTRDLIGQEAVGWFVANRDGLASDECGRFNAWLRASPIHIEEYLRVAVIARDLPRVCADPDSTVDAVVARARAQESGDGKPSLVRRLIGDQRSGPFGVWLAAGATAALAALCVGLALWSARPTSPLVSPEQIVALHYATGHGEQQNYRLADDSILHLNTDSSVTVRYGRTERRVVLDSGEAAFEVVHDPQRAFRVTAGVAQVVDVGTQFEVRLINGATLVTVLEGRVAVSPLEQASRVPQATVSGPPQSVQVGAGEQISLSAGSWPTTAVSVEAQRTTAWLHRQIIFEREPLEQVASEFNRYIPQTIEIASPVLRKLQISGVFSTDDPAAFIAFLRSLEGVRVEVMATRIRVSQAAAATGSVAR